MRMKVRRISRLLRATLVVSLCHFALPTYAQNAAPVTTPTPAGDGTFLLTIFLKHDESKTLSQINKQLKEQGYFKQFPPPGGV